MSFRHHALSAAACLAFVATSAGAVPMVDTYKVISNFTSGSIAQVTSTFTLAYDPAVANGAMAVTNYTSSISNPSFNPSLVQFTNDPSPGTSSAIAVGGSNAGPGGITNGTSDFRILFFVDPLTGAVAGSGRMLIPFNALTEYSLPGTTSTIFTFDTTVSLISSAVPEAATWAMMMVGIGVIGGSLRRRPKVNTRVSVA